MTDKQKKIGEFLTLLHELNENSVQADNTFGEVFSEGKPFSIACGKCGSMDIEVIGERGTNYGGQTGYEPGSTSVKCNGCGNAVCAWE